MKTTIVASVLLFLALGPAPGEAQVRLGVTPEGRKIITNEGSAAAGRATPRLRPVSDGEVQILIRRHSEAQSLDPKLVQALIQVESAYRVQAKSHKGAMGLMQLMPATASDYRVQDPYDPDENVRGGTQYLRHLIDRFPGRLELALAAYNAGPGAVERYNGIPPYRETREYVRKVLTLYRGTEPVLASSSAPLVRSAPGQRKAYITRNGQNRIVITTAFADTKR